MLLLNVMRLFSCGRKLPCISLCVFSCFAHASARGLLSSSFACYRHRNILRLLRSVSVTVLLCCHCRCLFKLFFHFSRSLAGTCHHITAVFYLCQRWALSSLHICFCCHSNSALNKCECTRLRLLICVIHHRVGCCFNQSEHNTPVITMEIFQTCFIVIIQLICSLRTLFSWWFHYAHLFCFLFALQSSPSLFLDRDLILCFMQRHCI